jgi:hypothetical protein
LMGQILHDLYDPRSCQSWGDRMTDWFSGGLEGYQQEWV